MCADFSAFSATGEETNCRIASMFRWRAWVEAMVAVCSSAKLTTWLCASASCGIANTTASVQAVATRTNCRNREGISSLLGSGLKPEFLLIYLPLGELGKCQRLYAGALPRALPCQGETRKPGPALRRPN